MARAILEVADIFRAHGERYRERRGASMSPQQRRVMRAIELCRTAALGGHVERCDACGHRRVSYNSCRNRHCPKCQTLAKMAWLAARRSELLPVQYFHVVFTLPEALAPLALQNKQTVYHLLFQATAQTLLRIAADPKHLGAGIGFLAILHTWGQNLLHHPHLHCVVPGGGPSIDGQRWVACRAGFFLPVRVLSRLFRRLFLEMLKERFDHGDLRFHGELKRLEDPQAFGAFIRSCRAAEWVVYAKPPFGGPDKVLDYLGRYTHRVAIANHRLLAMRDGRVTFGWKSYKHGGRRQTMTLEADEFIRRFLLHVLPPGFVRIRSYGWLANAHRHEKLNRCRQLLGVAAIEPLESDEEPSQNQDWAELEALTGKNPLQCPHCGRGRMIPIEDLAPTAGLFAPSREGIDSS